MKTDCFDYPLPPDSIAQYPAQKREESRLLVLDRSRDMVTHTRFSEIIKYFNPGDLLIRNNTRVINARVFAQKPTGGKVEIFFLKMLENGEWLGMVKSRRPLRQGSRVQTSRGSVLEIGERVQEGCRKIKLISEIRVSDFLEAEGEIPLPPYISRTAETQDIERYQTVYALNPGAVASPTAGLHFSQELLQTVKDKGIGIGDITLHISSGTFRPVKADYIENHYMDSEHYIIPQETADAYERCRSVNKRVISVGTTCVRTLESCYQINGRICQSQADTDIFIYPPYKFKTVDVLITNFHLPRSTLFIMVSAFCGLDRLKRVYAEAIEKGYRFYSYGDAMLIL